MTDRTSTFQTVALVARRQDRNITDTVLVVAEALDRLGADIVYEDLTSESIGPAGAGVPVAPRRDLAKRSDLVVVVGGDGSLLGVSRDLGQSGVPVVGVNRGGLGFLAAISPEKVREEFEAIWRGEYIIRDHFLLAAEQHRDGALIQSSTALNDVVVHSTSMAQMIEFSLWIDDEYVYDQRSDGVIVSSPTGSTAYSLSAGGPIMHPSLDAIVVVPMFPHTLTSRPLVVGGGSALRIEVTQGREAAQMSCDSQVNVAVELGDTVTIKKAPSPLKLLYPVDHSFYESCRSKLDWASRLGGTTG